jgi:hypothetical protein
MTGFFSFFVALGIHFYNATNRRGDIESVFIPWMIFATSIAVVVYTWYRSRVQDKVIDGTERMIRLKDLVPGRKFTVYAFSPATAKVTEAEIEEKLAIFKRHIDESYELSPTRAVEL